MAKEPKSTLKFTDVIGQIERGQIAPIYFIDGEEDYLQTEFIGTLKTALFKDNLKNANIERLTARVGKAADLITTALEYSLFGSGKLIIVHDAHKFNNDDKRLLLDFFPQLPAGNHLVFFHRDSPDMRMNYFKYLTTKATWISLLPLTQNTARFWVERQLRKFDLKIDSNAIDLLIDFAGFSYSTITEEINKLSLNFQPGAVITLDDVNNYGSRSAVFSIFELTDALGRKKRELALNRLIRLMESGETLSAILPSIQRHFNYLVMIHSLRELTSNEMVSARIGVHPFFVRKCREQLSLFGEDKLKEAMRYIFEAEYLSRFEQMPPDFILENLVVKISSL